MKRFTQTGYLLENTIYNINHNRNLKAYLIIFLVFTLAIILIMPFSILYSTSESLLYMTTFNIAYYSLFMVLYAFICVFIGYLNFSNYNSNRILKLSLRKLTKKQFWFFVALYTIATFAAVALAVTALIILMPVFYIIRLSFLDFIIIITFIGFIMFIMAFIFRLTVVGQLLTLKKPSIRKAYNSSRRISKTAIIISMLMLFTLSYFIMSLILAASFAFKSLIIVLLALILAFFAFTCISLSYLQSLGKLAILLDDDARKDLIKTYPQLYEK